MELRYVNMQFRPEEYDAIERAAKVAGVPIATWCARSLTSIAGRRSRTLVIGGELDTAAVSSAIALDDITRAECIIALNALLGNPALDRVSNVAVDVVDRKATVFPAEVPPCLEVTKSAKPKKGTK